MINIIKGMDKLYEKYEDTAISDDEMLEIFLENGYTKNDFKIYGNLEWAEKTAEEHGIEL